MGNICHLPVKTGIYTGIAEALLLALSVHCIILLILLVLLMKIVLVHSYNYVIKQLTVTTNNETVKVIGLLLF